MTAARRALPELHALAQASREDWRADDITAALAESTALGMTWQEQLREMTLTILDPRGRPSDLVPPHRRRTPPTGYDSAAVQHAKALALAARERGPRTTTPTKDNDHA
ncbi:hypothetical protein [Actinoallomurus sp. NPDC052274]|uniref:hypothetical protein n=1 Tax=Actinoallomurus sp. NPDC052274 TaxID=3155420 RepID=UPI003434218E